MNPLTANLKLLYQYKYLWPAHFLLLAGISIVPMAADKFDNVKLPFVMIVSLGSIFTLGVNIGLMSGEVLSKPLGFCLAHQIKAIQKMFLLVWLLITILTAPLVVSLSFENTVNELGYFFGSIGLISLSYWAGVAVILPKRRFIAFLIYFFIYVFILIMLPISIISGTDFVELIFIAHPWELFLLSSILICLIYRSVGRIARFNRKYLRLLNFEDIIFNKNKRSGRTSERIGSFFQHGFYQIKTRIF